MYFTSKSYQISKIKNYFKKKSLFIVFNCVKLNSKEWVQIEQKFKNLNLNYYKPLNKITTRELISSRYSNYIFVINSSVLFVSFNYCSLSGLTKDLNYLQNSLKPLLINVSLKLNNKLYSPQQLVKFQNLNYKKNVFKFYKNLTKFSKVTYLLSK